MVDAIEVKDTYTIEDAENAFADLRDELYGSNGSVVRMQRMIDNRDFEDLRRILQNYDNTLRDGKIRMASAFLPRAERTITDLTGNAIAMDVIGMEQNCVEGKENPKALNRYLNELRTDLKTILDQEQFTVTKF